MNKKKHKLLKEPSNEHSYEAWFHLAQWLQRRLKCVTALEAFSFYITVIHVDYIWKLLLILHLWYFYFYANYLSGEPLVLWLSITLTVTCLIRNANFRSLAVCYFSFCCRLPYKMSDYTSLVSQEDH
jgi:hypothetical protein